jgi:hypothetical protein
MRCSAFHEFMLRIGLSLQPIPKPLPKPKPKPAPLSPAPKRQYQKTKDREFKHAAPHGTRHSYQPYIREISTPDWEPAKPASRPGANFSAFDICEIHGRLELFEHRIINGHDPLYSHPAQCIPAAEEREFDPNQTEAEKTQRYQNGEVIERIPRFWPDRKWDRPADRMSEEETKKLQDAIAGPGGDASLKMVKSPARVRPSSTGPHRVKKTSVLPLDFHNYRTDGSDGETDWDEF